MDLHSAITAAFTFLFFAGATARISFYPSPADLPLLPTAVKPLPEARPAATAADSNIVLPSEISKPDSGASESEKSRMFGVDLTPRTDLARFHAINRHFFDEPRVPSRSVHRRPYRRFVNPFAIPRSEISHGDEPSFSSGDVEALHRRDPSKRMKVKHDYHHRNHHLRHHHHHNHLHLHHNNDGSVPKHVSDREKVKGTSVVSQQQHTEKSINIEHHEAGFMNRFRKFLKHTFD